MSFHLLSTNCFIKEPTRKRSKSLQENLLPWNNMVVLLKRKLMPKWEENDSRSESNISIYVLLLPSPAPVAVSAFQSLSLGSCEISQSRCSVSLFELLLICIWRWRLNWLLLCYTPVHLRGDQGSCWGFLLLGKCLQNDH